MTKNLGMTMEERHVCEKKAAKFENKLFDIMKNLEQKYKNEQQSETPKSSLNPQEAAE
jgi:hypothetical protein